MAAHGQSVLTHRTSSKPNGACRNTGAVCIGATATTAIASITDHENQSSKSVDHTQQADAGDYRNNFWTNPQDFVQPLEFNYQLKDASKLAGQTMDPGQLDGKSLLPTAEYVHPYATRPFPGYPQHRGMMQSVGLQSSV